MLTAVEPGPGDVAQHGPCSAGDAQPGNDKDTRPIGRRVQDTQTGYSIAGDGDEKSGGRSIASLAQLARKLNETEMTVMGRKIATASAAPIPREAKMSTTWKVKAVLKSAHHPSISV
jgi:hypothetical protein